MFPNSNSFYLTGLLKYYVRYGLFTMYEGCQESSWTHMITAANVPEFDIHFSLK